MNKPNRNRALVELLMVVTIILITASLPIPRLNKEEIPAHEASALASIKAVHESEMMFGSTHPGGESSIESKSRH